MKQRKYKKFIVWLKSVKTRTHLTFFIVFGLHKSDELEVGHVLSYYNKNQLPSLASTQLIFFYEIHIQQISGSSTTSWLNEYTISFPRDKDGKLDEENGIYDMKK